MKICGIIAEYNPFHNGHEYHLKRTKEISGADYIVVCMSGDFVQRGIPAIADKYARAGSALLAGADLVLELPAVYATGSADYFAKGAVSLLDGVGCDLISFGSETGNIEALNTAAEVYSKAETDHANEIAFHIREGSSYVKALNEVCRAYYAVDEACLCPDSNDKLGIAYIKNIKRLNSSMKALAVKREGSAYLDGETDGNSAMAIRNALHASSDPWTIRDRIPEYSYDALFEEPLRSCPVYANDFSDMLYMKLKTITDGMAGSEELTGYLDVSQNIAGRIIKNLNTFSAYDRFAYSVLTPEYTISRINRALLHILLEIKENDMIFSDGDCTPYARILGFREQSAELMSEIKRKAKLQIITKPADGAKKLSDAGRRMFERDVFASELYEHVASGKYDREKISELRRNPIII